MRTPPLTKLPLVVNLSLKMNALLILTSILGYTFANPSFFTLIPNADSIPNPCNRIRTIRNPTHSDLAGGADAEINQFGMDMARVNYSWPALCPLDSDGDGLSNGQELGDPFCKWTPGCQISAMEYILDTALSHPGVCEPLESASCQKANSKMNIDCSLFQVSLRRAFNIPQPQQTQIRQQSPCQPSCAPEPQNSPSPCPPVPSDCSSQTSSIDDFEFPPNFVFCSNNQSPLKTPTKISEAQQCSLDNPCPSGYGCVVGPTKYIKMAVCCPVPPPPPNLCCPTTAPTTTQSSCCYTPTQPPTPPPTPPSSLCCSPVAQPPPVPRPPTLMIPFDVPPTPVVALPIFVPVPAPAPAPPSPLEEGPAEWCFDQPQVGPCEKLVVAWYFNIESNDCLPFAYGGCLQSSTGQLRYRGTFVNQRDCKNTCRPLAMRMSSG